MAGFNKIRETLSNNSAGSRRRSTPGRWVFFSGNDVKAKETVFSIIEAIGLQELTLATLMKMENFNNFQVAAPDAKPDKMGAFQIVVLDFDSPFLRIEE